MDDPLALAPVLLDDRSYRRPKTAIAGLRIRVLLRIRRKRCCFGRKGPKSLRTIGTNGMDRELILEAELLTR